MTPISCLLARTPGILAALLFLLPTSLLAQPVTLKRAVELALKHATATDIAAADEQRAFAAYRELRNNFIPQLTAGAGLGWSHGFPLVPGPHLSNLIPIPPAEIQLESDSLPATPETTPATHDADANPMVKAAVEHARAQFLRAQAEHKSWLPSLDFAAQYAVLSRFNN